MEDAIELERLEGMLRWNQKQMAYATIERDALEKKLDDLFNDEREIRIDIMRLKQRKNAIS